MWIELNEVEMGKGSTLKLNERKSTSKLIFGYISVLVFPFFYSYRNGSMMLAYIPKQLRWVDNVGIHREKTGRQIDDGPSEANISPNLSRIIEKIAQMPQMQTFIAKCVCSRRSWLNEGKSLDTFIANHHTMKCGCWQLEESFFCERPIELKRNRYRQ